MASIRTVKKLGLATTKHPRPYQLQGLGVEGKFEVTQQVRVAFSIGRYQDEVLCDVVPIQVCHLLLGEPWQSDRKVIHDERTNRYSFKHQGRKFTLAPLTPKQVSLGKLHWELFLHAPIQCCPLRNLLWQLLIGPSCNR